jgi:hypothetical protein
MLFQKLASTIDASQLRFVVHYSAGLSVLCSPLIPHMLLVSVQYAVVNAFKGHLNLKPPYSWVVFGIETPASLTGYNVSPVKYTSIIFYLASFLFLI